MPNIISQYLNGCEALFIENGVSKQSNEAYAAYLQTLRALSEKIDSFYQVYPESDQKYPYPPMTEENVAELRNLYASAFAASDQYRRFLESSGEAENKMSVERLNLMDGIDEAISRDYTALANTAAVAGKTLPEVIDTARSYQVDVTGQQLGAVGANMSQRIPVRFTDKNGTEKKGFFTSNSVYEGEKEKQEYTDELFNQYPDENDRKIINALLSSPVQGQMIDSSTIMPFIDNAAKEVPYPHVFDQYLKELVPREATEEEINSFIDRVSQSRQFTTAIATYFIKKANYTNKVGAFDEAKINVGSRIDQRNAAMSAVADLLGKPNLLARSVNMKVKNGDSETDGVFMELASGSDMNHLKPDDPLRRCERKGGKNFESPKAFKEIADLQTLDYICGNIDRHLGNMFYQFEETEDGPRLSGVVGIDNDLSFGGINSKYHVNKMVGPKEMLVISESMANRVSSMTRDMLELTLKNFDLSEKEINAAWERVTSLKEEIQAGIEYFREHPDKKLAAEKLRIVPDNKWAEYSLNDLSKKITIDDKKYVFNYTYFSDLESVPRAAISIEEEQIAEKELEAERRERIPELMKQSSSNVAEGKLLDLQENSDYPFRADDNYLQIVEAVKAAREKVTLLTTPDTHGAVPKLTENDISELKETFRAISEKASEYVGNPPENPDGSWRIKKEYCDQIRKNAMQDYVGLDDAKLGQTLDEVLSGVGSRTVDITGKKIKTVGNSLSLRMKLTITGEDGTPVKGFFTRRKTLNLEQEANKALRAASEKYPHLAQKAEEVIGYMVDERIAERNRAERIENLLQTMKNPDERKTIQDAIDYVSDIQTAKGNYWGMIGDITDTPIDTRNVAMSRVADLCGCGDLLAKSIPMKLIENNREVEGTFMYNANGSDILHMKPDDPLLNVKADCLDHSPALRQLADIAIVDFICNNVDRHEGNLFYQMDNTDPANPKIVGVTGIDNDMAFGGMLFGGVATNRNTSGLDGITCISASMAERVRSLNPDTLRLAMDGTGLKKENLDCTVKRLQMLKDKLAGKEIRVIPNEDFVNYKLEDLKAPPHKTNVFDCVAAGIDKVLQKELKAEKPKENEAPQEEDTLDMTAIVDRNSLAQDIAPLQEIRDDLTLAEKWVFGGSQQYKDVRDCTKGLLNLMARYTNPDYAATERDEKAVLQAYAETKNVCELYLQRKREDGHINDGPDTKPGRRIAAVRKLLNFCENRTKSLEQAISPQTEVGEIQQESEQLQEEAFRNMQPNELGGFIKNLNEMARQVGNQPQTVSKIGSQISAAMVYAQKNKLKAGELGLKKEDIEAVVKNIENGRKANVTLSAQNEKKQAAPDKMAQKKETPKIMQKPLVTGL